MHEHVPQTLQEALNTCKIVNIKAGTFFNLNGSKFRFLFTSCWRFRLLMERVCAGFNNLSFTAVADVPTAGRCRTRTIKPDKALGKSTRHSESVFRQLQQRSIHGGRLLGQHIKTIHCLCRLEQHQLLLNRESCTLARAVLARECHVDQQQCELSKNIDALRLFGAFLRIMEKSPGLKTALGQMICHASSPASRADRDTVQIYSDDPMAQLVTLNVHLKSILVTLQDQLPCTPEVEQSFLKATISKIKELRTLHFPEELRHLVETGMQEACFPFGNYLENTVRTIAGLRSRLANAVSIFDRAATYEQMHERIDWLEMHTILQPESEFMALLQIITYLRVPDEQIPSLDGVVDIHSLFVRRNIYGRKYYEHLTSMLTALWTFTNNNEQLGPDDVGVSNHPLWVNYLGGCHLELLHYPLHFEFKALGPPWLGDSLANLRNCTIQRHEHNYPTRTENFCAATINTIVFALRFDQVALCTALTGFLTDVRDCYILPGRVFQHLLNGSYLGMNGIERFMSLLIRSGLEFDVDGLMSGDALCLRCPACEFTVEVQEHIRHRDIAEGPAVMQPFFSNYDPVALVRKIEHIHQDLFSIMRLHQVQQRSCTVAGAINVQQLLHDIRRESDRENSLNG